MEDVYVIRVKSKPELSSLYPSERRYSASTVGGLSIIHAVFGSVGLFLACTSRSAQGFVLFVCCLAPLVSGLLAWKKWYIDKNIAIFFYCSIFSTVISLLCFGAALYDISLMTEKLVMSRFDENDSLYNQTVSPTANFTLEVTTVMSWTEMDYVQENSTSALDEIDGVEEKDSDHSQRVEILIFLTINIAIACLLEFLWSLLSTMIALKGMKREFSDDSRANSGDKHTKTVSNLPSRPDIILMNKHICCSMQSLDSLQSLNTQHMYPKLPLPESNKEFKERVDKFLANQVHHRNDMDGN